MYIGEGQQIINFNFVPEFIAENLNKILYPVFTPGVLKFNNYSFTPTTFTISEFSGFVRPKYKNIVVKVDSVAPYTFSTDYRKTYLVVRMDWITPPNGYDYIDTSDIISSCTFSTIDDKVIFTAHNLIVGDVIRFTLTNGGVTENTDYYVIKIDTNWFQISSTATGTATDLTGVMPISNSYKKMTNHIIRYDFIPDYEYDPTYDVLLAVLSFTGPLLTSVSTVDQTRVYLTDYCINYDTIQRENVRTLSATNSSLISDGVTNRTVGNSSGNIPLSNFTLNVNLNSELLSGITAGNEPNSLAVKNLILSKNSIAARLFLGSYEYAIGRSGIISYSECLGYSGLSGFSSYSGYIPISNTVLQEDLNAEFLGGYKLDEFSDINHSHVLDEIVDGTTYGRILWVDTDGLVTTDGIYDESLQYRHQNTTTPFRFDNSGTSGIAKKIFVLAGEIGAGGSTTVTFRKAFSTAPRVFILNDESDEFKAVDESTISTTGFIIRHNENTKSDGSGYLVTDMTSFKTHWLAIGEI